MDALRLISASLADSFLNQCILLLVVLNGVFFYQARRHTLRLKAALFEGESLLEKFVHERLTINAGAEAIIRERFAGWEREYQAATGWYHLFTNTISAFPLLGIAGTVWGIIPALQDLSQLDSGFALALVSTFLGIIAALAFKFAEGLLSGDFALVSDRMNLITGDIVKYLLEKGRTA